MKTFLRGMTLVIIIVATSCAGKKPLQQQTRFIMDTVFTVKIPGGIEVIPSIEKAFARIEEIETKFNALNPKSPIYDFNNSNIPIEDEEIVSLIRIALEVSDKTMGKYDITIFPLVELWGFYTESPRLPGPEKIMGVLKDIGYKKILIQDGRIVKKNNNVKIDLGSIAKGYALGEAYKVLKNDGIQSCLIDGGGDIYIAGDYAGKPWKVGIRNPVGEGVIGSLELTDCAVVTSGNYERFFEKDGMRYHHILDPETGYPSNGLTSVTVISTDPTLADAWSTAVFTLGKEKGPPIADTVKTIQILMITDDGKMICSSCMNVNVQKL